MSRNLDSNVVEGFGREWVRFDQSGLDAAELRRMFESYFRIFPWGDLPADAVGFDLGCGTGRWAAFVSQRVGHLHCIDASQPALQVAKKNLRSASNCSFHLASVDEIPLVDGSCDFGYSLGVLHHVPDATAGLCACVQKLKPAAPFLVYLYYALDNRPGWYRAIWRSTDAFRWIIASAPYRVRHAVADLIAATVYWPIARFAKLIERLGRNPEVLPLAAYRDKSFYVMRTDSLDRFGTALEQRFSRDQIREMMQAAGLRDIRFSEQPPFWCAVGFRAPLMTRN